ncbi:MAG: DUF4352 domain-containing protein [Ruminococcus sp.]|jgi:hypothetical protein
MKRKPLLITLTLLSLLTFSLFGCNSNGGSDTDAENPAPTEAAADSEGNADKTGSDTKDKKTETKEENAQTDGEDQTPVEDIQGEGTTDTEVPDLSSIDTAPLDQDCVVTAESGAELATLRIEKAEVTDERDENNSSNPEKVVVIDYSYTNSSDEPLLLDNMSFKLVEGDTTCTPYYAAFLKTAEPAKNGESSSGQIAFEVSSDFTEGTLVFDSSLAGEDLSFKIEV